MRKICNIIGSFMVLIAVVFIVYAFKHPESSFSWPAELVLILYAVYIIVTVCLFTIPAYLIRKNNKHR